MSAIILPHPGQSPQSPSELWRFEKNGPVPRVAWGSNTTIVGKCGHKSLSWKGAWTYTIASPERLAAHIAAGYPYMPARIDPGFGRIQAACNFALILALDVDAGLTIAEALAKPFIRAHLTIGIESASSRIVSDKNPDGHEKFRLIFVLAAPIEGHKNIRLCNEFLAHVVGNADPACKDASRFFFGSPGREAFVLTHNTLPRDFLEQAQAWGAERDRAIEAERAAKKVAWEERQAARGSSAVAGQGFGTSSLDQVAAALECIPPYSPGGGTYHNYVRIAGAVLREFGAAGRAALLASPFGGGQFEKGVDRFLDSVERSRPTGREAGVGSLFGWAKQFGYKPARADSARQQSRGTIAQRYPEIAGLTHTPAITLGERYLPDLELPAGGGILAIDSPMGTGKTEVMKGLITQAKAVDPDCLIELIGYRNSLGKQSAARLGIDHIHDLQGSGVATTFIRTSPALAYCLDSLHRRIDAVQASIAAGHKTLVLIDEIDSVLKHVFLGGTLGMRRSEVLLAFCGLLNAVASSGGWIVAGEADLTSLPIAFLENATGLQATLIQNTYKGSPWHVETPIAFSAEGEPMGHMAGMAAISRVVAELDAGRRVAVATDSATWATVLGRMVGGLGYKNRVLCADTAEEPWAQCLVSAPDEFLAEDKAECLIYSPTAESGLSITGDHFDCVVAYGSHLEHRAIAQLIGRVRTNIPRAVFCRDYAVGASSDGEGTSSDPELLQRDWLLNAQHSQRGARLTGEAPDIALTVQGTLLHDFAARFQARINASRGDLRGSLLTALAKQGHQLTETSAWVSAELTEKYTEIREAIDNELAVEFAATDIEGRTPEWARRTLGSGTSTRIERIGAQKMLAIEAYPALPVDDAAFVLRNLITAKGAALRAHSALFYAQNRLVAQAIDREFWSEQGGKKLIWLPSVKRESVKAALIAHSGLIELLQATEYTEADERVQAVKTFALAHAPDIRRLWGLNCDESQTAITIVNKLARKLGVSTTHRRHGARGQQKRVWSWVWDGPVGDDRTAIHAALAKKWDALLTHETPVATILDSQKPVSKIVATEPAPSPSTVILGGARWVVRSIEGLIARLAPADRPDAPPIEIPLHRIQAA